MSTDQPYFAYTVRKPLGVVAGFGDAGFFDPATQMGPLITEEQQSMVLGYVEGGIRDGALAVAGGSRGLNSGFFMQPTLLTGVTEDSDIQRDEVFGPVVTAVPFNSEDDEFRQANDTRYGLAAAVVD